MCFDAFLILWCLTNLVAFATYGLDKFQAAANGSRIPEARLLSLALVGGLGAMAASSVFRHKTRKQPFRRYAVTLAGIHLVLTTAGLVILYGYACRAP